MTYFGQLLVDAQAQAMVKAVEQSVFGSKDKVVNRDDDYFTQIFMADVFDKEEN